jgi:hypothetical protein
MCKDTDIKQIEMHTAGLLVPDSSPFDVEIGIAKFERYKLSSSDQIPANMIQIGYMALWSEIHKLVNSILR